MDKAVDFVQAKIDEFGRKVFGREIRVGKAPEALPLPTETGASVGVGMVHQHQVGNGKLSMKV